MRSLKPDRRREASPPVSSRPLPTSRRRRLFSPGALLFGVFVISLAGCGLAVWQASAAGLVSRIVSVVDAAFDHAMVSSGLAVRGVLVEGRRRTARVALLEAVSIQTGESILGVNLDITRARVAKLAWVKSVRIDRRLPDTIFIHLIEREPLALWQREGELSLIDRDGEVIPDHRLEDFQDLPIVIGKNAPSQTGGILKLLAGEPDLSRRVRALTWVGERRWDVRLDGRIKVQLPEVDPRAAWSQLARLEREHGVLRRDVVAIDMRLRDQLVVRVAPGTPSSKRDSGRDT